MRSEPSEMKFSMRKTDDRTSAENTVRILSESHAQGILIILYTISFPGMAQF
jgi:hypothetical protein